LSEQDLDSELVERARQGDATAFGALVTRYQRLLTSLAYGILENQARTEDAVQEAFATAWRTLPGFRAEGRFRNWLCRIAVNKACSALRWGRLRSWLSLDAGPGEGWGETLRDESSGSDPERVQLEDERSRAVREAVASLPLQQRTAVLLRSEGLDVMEVAQAMDVAEGTVKAHLYHARARLAEALEGR